MFRRIAKQMHAHREPIVSLLLMPAFLIGTMPHTACICADGHREVVCPAMAGRFTLQRSNAGASSERSCCSAKVGCCSQPSAWRARRASCLQREGRLLLKGELLPRQTEPTTGFGSVCKNGLVLPSDCRSA